MSVHKRVLSGIVAGLAVAMLAVGPVVAQEAESSEEGTTVEVIGVEYAYEGLPTSVPSGTTLTFTNEGVEVHEMVTNRLADGVTESFEELLEMWASGVDLEAEGFIDPEFGDQVLLAGSGQTAEGSITLDAEGRYVVLCFIPTGLETATLVEYGVDPTSIGPETDPATLSPEAQAYIEGLFANPPHAAQGMIQEFVVTAPGTEIGPLPDMDAAESAAEDAADSAEAEAEDMADDLEAQADAKEDELEEKADEAEEKIKGDG